MRIRTLALPLWSVFLLAIPPRAAAQDRYVEVAVRHARPTFFHEAIVLPADSGATATIHFRIPNSLLVFRQANPGFVADVEVTAEIYAGEKKREERIWRRTHRAESFEETQSRQTDLSGFMEFDLPPGEYSYRLFLREGVAGDLGAVAPRQFTVPTAEKDRLWRPFFVDAVDTTSGRLALTATGLRGDAPFGRHVEAAVPIAGTADASEIGYNLYRVALANESVVEREGRLERYEIRDGDVLVKQGDARVTLPLGSPAGNSCFCRTMPPDAEAGLALIDVGSETLQDGLYVLDVHLGEARSQLIFGTRWRGMPLSLFDIEVAIRNLEFIEPRERVRAMLKGSREERIEKFREYWKERDPTPATLANELMEEYYRRVDYAALEYRTGGAPYPDGLRTDAARVYIVNGPPAKVTHSFPTSGGVEQVWHYADGRKFVFRSASSLEPLVLVGDRRQGHR